MLLSEIDVVLVLLHLKLALLQHLSLLRSHVLKFLAHILDMLSLSMVDVRLPGNLFLSVLNFCLSLLVLGGELLVVLT